MKGKVLVDHGLLEEFSVNIELKHGSSSSPLLFIIGIELMSRRVSKGGRHSEKDNRLRQFS